MSKMDNSDDEYYSEDFEQDELEGVVEVIQEVKITQPSIENVGFPEGIIDYKSPNGHLTIQPRKPSNLPPRTNSESKINVRNKIPTKKYFLQRPSNPKPTPQIQIQSLMVPQPTTNPSTIKVQSEDSLVEVISPPSPDNDVQIESRQSKTRQIVPACPTPSGVEINKIPVKRRATTTTIRKESKTQLPNNKSSSEKLSQNNNNTTVNIKGAGRCIPKPKQVPPKIRVGVARPGNITQRLASARRMNMNEMRNKLSLLSREADELTRENKSLKVVTHRQSQALKKWEGKDAELPKLLQQHKDELKTAQNHLKKVICHCRDLEERIKVKDKRISKMEQELNALNALVSKENLKDRCELQQQVEVLCSDIATCEKRIRQYMRHIEIMEGNHKHEIMLEKQKHIKTNNHALELRHEISSLKIALRDKDRILNYIQMRSIGRSLMKAFQEKERLQNSKFPGRGQCGASITLVTITPRSSSVSPTRKRGPSLDENVASSRRQNIKPLPPKVDDDSSLSSEIKQGDDHKVKELKGSPRTLEAERQTSPLREFNGSGDGSYIQDQQQERYDNPQQFDNSVISLDGQKYFQTKNEYYKMSRMLGAQAVPKKLEKKILKKSSSNPTPARNQVDTNIGKSSSVRLTGLKETSQSSMHSKKSKSNNTSPGTVSVQLPIWKMRAPQQQHFPIFVHNGPRTHSEAKKEMKEKEQLAIECFQRKKHDIKTHLEKKEPKLCNNDRPLQNSIDDAVTDGSADGFRDLTFAFPSGRNESSLFSPRRDEEPVILLSSPHPIDPMIVPPPPSSYENGIQLKSPQSGLTSLTERQQAEIKSHEAVMADFLVKNSQKIAGSGLSGQSYSVPQMQSSPRLLQDSQCRQVFHHQNQQMQNVPPSTSARGHHPKLSCSEQHTTYRSPHTEPQVQMGYLAPENYSMPRKIFSYSNAPPISQFQNSHLMIEKNHPMNLPFFSAAGDVPQQVKGSKIPCRISNEALSKSSPTAKANSSHYDPSFFSKLGSWK